MVRSLLEEVAAIITVYEPDPINGLTSQKVGNYARIKKMS